MQQEPMLMLEAHVDTEKSDRDIATYKVQFKNIRM